eukprot:786383-Amphidinium_carterae.1
MLARTCLECARPLSLAADVFAAQRNVLDRVEQRAQLHCPGIDSRIHTPPVLTLPLPKEPADGSVPLCDQRLKRLDGSSTRRSVPVSLNFIPHITRGFQGGRASTLRLSVSKVACQTVRGIGFQEHRTRATDKLAKKLSVIEQLTRIPQAAKYGAGLGHASRVCQHSSGSSLHSPKILLSIEVDAV